MVISFFTRKSSLFVREDMYLNHVFLSYYYILFSSWFVRIERFFKVTI
nr:MAG TPA: hypothetical protein [Caudoviricetes sp.]